MRLAIRTGEAPSRTRGQSEFGGGKKRRHSDGGSVGSDDQAVEVIASRSELRKTEHVRARADGPQRRVAAGNAHPAARVAIAGEAGQIRLIGIPLGEQTPAKIARP